MFRKLIIPATLGLTALCALIPAAASAQTYGGWSGQYYSGSGYGQRYDDRDRARSSYDDDGGYYARQRWPQHRRWEQEARRRYWQHRRWDHRDDHHDYDRDGRDWRDDRGY